MHIVKEQKYTRNGTEFHMQNFSNN